MIEERTVFIVVSRHARDRIDFDDDLTNLAQSNGNAERKSESAEAESATKEEGETPGDDADMNEEDEADVEEDSEDDVEIIMEPVVRSLDFR